MLALDSQSVLVIGAASGIGQGVARAVISAGGRVITASRFPARAADTAAALGDRAMGIALDFGEESTLADAARTLGQVDHVVSVAADQANGPLATLAAEDVEAAYRAKVVGPILLAKHLAPVVRPGGALVLFSGYVSARPAPELAVMAATNGAVEALVPALAVELAPVRVVGVSPGVVDSGSWDAMPDRDGFFRSVAATNPARRIGSPDDIAHGVLFALTNPFLTATTLHLDGGQPFA